MEARLLREPNLIFETSVLLFNSRTGQSSRELKETIQKRFAIDRNVLDSCFDAIIEMSDYVVNNIRVDEELLDFLSAGTHQCGVALPFTLFTMSAACRIRILAQASPLSASSQRLCSL